MSKRGLVIGNELQFTLTFRIQSDHLPEDRLSLQMLSNFPQSNWSCGSSGICLSAVAFRVAYGPNQTLCQWILRPFAGD